MGLVEKWRKIRAHTYASENADHYRGFDAGLAKCADELEARDKEIRAMAQDLIGHCDGLARHLGREILEKLGG